jgi:SAM-dependent methyltransferase
MSESLLDHYRQQSLETWEALAQVWAREREFMWQVSGVVGTWLVDNLDIKPGDTVLELAAGTGETGYAAARAVGDSGKVISTDFSPEMVEMARSGGEEQGLTNLEYRVMDAEHMGLDDDSVDGVICRWGYMLMADPEAALRETRRVLRPGGKLAFSVWGPADRNLWALHPAALLVERGMLTPPEPGMPGIFALADTERIKSVVKAAGFGDPQIHEVPIEWTYQSFDDYWDFVSQVSGPIAFAIQKLSDADVADVKEKLRERTAGFAEKDGFRLPGLCLNVVAQ